MSGEVQRWLSTTPAQRERDRTVDRIRNQASASVARVEAITEVGQAAILGTLTVVMTQRQAELMAPEATSKLDLIATQVAIALGQEVQSLRGRL